MEKFMVNLKYMKAPTKASPAPVVSTTFTLSVAALGTGQCITFLSELVVKVKGYGGVFILVKQKLSGSSLDLCI